MTLALGLLCLWTRRTLSTEFFFLRYKQQLVLASGVSVCQNASGSQHKVVVDGGLFLMRCVAIEEGVIWLEMISSNMLKESGADLSLQRLIAFSSAGYLHVDSVEGRLAGGSAQRLHRK